MKKVKFEFGDGNIYDGLTDGSTWNGFANIWVENKVYRQILNNYDHSMYDYKESELFELKQWIIEDWLSNREQDSVDEDSQYYKYCQLNDALDTLENGEDK